MSHSAQRGPTDRELARDADTLPAPAPADSSLPPPPSAPALRAVAHNFTETLAPPAPSCFTETLVPPSLEEELENAKSA